MISSLSVFLRGPTPAKEAGQLPLELNTKKKVESHKRFLISVMLITSVATLALAGIGLAGLLQTHGLIKIPHSFQWINAQGNLYHYVMLGGAGATTFLVVRSGYLLHKLNLQKTQCATKMIDYFEIDPATTPLDQMFMVMSEEHPVQEKQQTFDEEFFGAKLEKNKYTFFCHKEVVSCVVHKEDGLLYISPYMSRENWQIVERRIRTEMPDYEKATFTTIEYKEWRRTRNGEEQGMQQSMHLRSQMAQLGWLKLHRENLQSTAQTMTSQTLKLSHD